VTRPEPFASDRSSETEETSVTGEAAVANGTDVRGDSLSKTTERAPRGTPDEIFDPSVSSSTEGLGIGLWIVREVATGHGWSVVATESEGGGARFEFEIGV